MLLTIFVNMCILPVLCSPLAAHVTDRQKEEYMPQTDSPSSSKKTYRSPQRILVRFFEKSRDQWKTKCLDAKAALRRFKNRAKWLETSRDQWRTRVQAFTRRIQELEAQNAEQQHVIETLKKSHAPQKPLQQP